MRKIEIDIKRGQIKSFSVTLGEEYPDVSATIALFTEGGRQISEYSISTSAWNESLKFKLPPSMIAPIKEIMDDLERVAIEHCNNQILKLGEGKNEQRR